MSPLARPIAIVGMLALLVTAWLLATNQIMLTDAGYRALVIVLVAKALDRLADWGLHRAALAAARVSHRGQIVAAVHEPVEE